jgi:hypothetical protein
MYVLESFTEQAPGKTMNEDALVITKDLAAVIDGAGDHHDRTFEDKTWGRLAADCLAEAIHELDPTTDSREALLRLHHHLNDLDRRLPPELLRNSPPAASVVIYNNRKREVWRVGDAKFAINGRTYEVRTAFDDLQVNIKRLIYESIEQDRNDWLHPTEDLGTILKILHNYQPGLENPQKPGPFALSVLDGRRPPMRIERFQLTHDANALILASDGYPKLLGTLKETEDFLLRVLQQDPLLLGEYAQPKLTDRREIWDDRTYLRLMVASEQTLYRGE